MDDGAHVFAMGTCYSCGNPFTFNPNLVPSVRVDGVRQPICRACIERANPKRVDQGLAPITILPGAYEPAPESSVDWNDHD